MITSVAAVMAITVGALVGLRLNQRGADPVAVFVAGISTSHSAGVLAQARQHMILMDAAAATFSIVSSPKLAKQPVPVAAGVPTTTSTATDVTAASLPSGPPPDPGTAQSIGYQMLPSFGFDPATQYGCLNNIFERESGWRYNAENASGAYGIPQALPGDKMASAGPDWQTNPATQIRWGLGYIKDRYGSPCNAWAFWEANGWY